MGGTNLAEVLDTADLGFSFGPVDIVSTVVDGRVLFHALSRIDNRITTIELTSSGLVVLGSLNLTGSWRVGVEPRLTVTDVGLYVEGLEIDPLVVLDTEGVPLAQADSGALLSPEHVTSLGAGLMVSANTSGTGLDLFTSSTGTLVWSGEHIDTTQDYLTNISDTASFAHAGATWLIVASADEDGVTLLRVEPDQSLTATASLGVVEGLPINDPSALDVIDTSSAPLILIASRQSKSLTVLRADETGQLELTDHVLDTATSFFADASVVSSTSHHDFIFVAIGGSDSGVTLLTLLANGRLQNLTDIADTPDTTLFRPASIDLTVIDETLHITISSLMDQGLTRLVHDLSTLGGVFTAPLGGASLVGTSLDDQILGSDVADTLDGSAGDDILFDGSGMDVLKGGVGADLFVFAPDGLPDTIIGFEPGVDRLDLSSFAFLQDISQLQITPTSEGATLSYDDEVIHLLTADGTALASGALETNDILDLDRPLVSTAGQSLKGGAGSDTIIGGNSGDTILGGGGNDAIRGENGDDWISGGDGGDILFGDGPEDWSDPFDWGGA